MEPDAVQRNSQPVECRVILLGALSPVRRFIRTLSERVIVGLIHLSGVSAIIFVFAIFYFVFREGAPFLRDTLEFKDFFLSETWYPTSASNKRYGILALLAGTGSVTGLRAPNNMIVAPRASVFSSGQEGEAGHPRMVDGA